MQIVTAGVVLGVGLGGLIDGIVLHQSLQWHNMLSAVVPPTTMAAMRFNMLWDGLFHAAMWLVTVAGIWMLWGDRQRTAPTPSVFGGQLLLGWGGFNLLEGLVDHHLLNLHHVRDMPHHVPLYDWVFLAVGGLLFILLGLRLVLPDRRRIGT